MNREVTILTGEPTVSVVAEMQLDMLGVVEMAEWVRAHRPECLPDDFNTPLDAYHKAMRLFPHGGQREGGMVTHNELLVELSGRTCYHSFGLKAGRKSNAEYIANTQQGDIPHSSVMYHAKMSFFIGGVSRRVSHELIRNYVGADRDEEGSPSQESTRFTHHYGFYVAHPYIFGNPHELPPVEAKQWCEYELGSFGVCMQENYDTYLRYVDRQILFFKSVHGAEPKGIERKRIYESASPYLSHACETSWVWTSNPIALAKMFRERDNDGADLEFRRLAKKWKRICVERWPGLFCQPWMRE